MCGVKWSARVWVVKKEGNAQNGGRGSENGGAFPRTRKKGGISRDVPKWVAPDGKQVLKSVVHILMFLSHRPWFRLGIEPASKP